MIVELCIGCFAILTSVGLFVAGMIMSSIGDAQIQDIGNIMAITGLGITLFWLIVFFAAYCKR